MNISVMYKIYHRSCDFSTGSAWVSSNRLVRAQLYAKSDGWIAKGWSGFAMSTQQECTVYPTVAAQEQGARLPTSLQRRLF